MRKHAIQFRVTIWEIQSTDMIPVYLTTHLLDNPEFYIITYPVIRVLMQTTSPTLNDNVMTI